MRDTQDLRAAPGPLTDPPDETRGTEGPERAMMAVGVAVFAAIDDAPGYPQERERSDPRQADMKTSRSKRAKSEPSDAASWRIDARIEELGDWRGELLSQIRALIKEVDPEVVEEWKWRGTPVWSHEGILCTGETYKDKVKMTFAQGAALKDPAGLFNSSLEGNVRRAIDFHEGDELDEKALRALIRAAVGYNDASTRR